MNNATSPILNDFMPRRDLAVLIERARLEDLGDQMVDVTSSLLIGSKQIGEAVMTARQAGRLAGVAMLGQIARAYDPTLDLQLFAQDARPIGAGDVIARYQGPLRSLLMMERVALNFISHLSGIATLTARYVERVAANKAQICDTRKTLPALRGLQKYAVACGGGTPHRSGLYDAMLIKDNHIAHLATTALADAIKDVIAQAHRRWPHLKFLEMEVDTLEQLEQVLPLGLDIVLLDNMSADHLRQAVALRDRIAGDVLLEASGNVTLDTVADIAATGVDRIAIGALTHSATSLDIGLDIG